MASSWRVRRSPRCSGCAMAEWQPVGSDSVCGTGGGGCLHLMVLKKIMPTITVGVEAVAGSGLPVLQFGFAALILSPQLHVVTLISWTRLFDLIVHFGTSLNPSGISHDRLATFGRLCLQSVRPLRRHWQFGCVIWVDCSLRFSLPGAVLWPMIFGVLLPVVH